ncbi:MAG: efflux RND transporter permease subunit [Panacagrimonas sp.]
MRERIAAFYFQLVLRRAWLVGLLMVAVIATAAYALRDFRLDASADSLMLEGDQDLRYYRGVADRYGAAEFLVVAYTPQADLFSDTALNDLKVLRDQLEALPAISSVMSILDVPLIDSPRVTLTEIQQHQRLLLDADVDRALARREFQTSPVYRDLVMSPDGRTTAMLLNLQPNPRAEALFARRNELRILRDEAGLNGEQAAELSRVTSEYAAASAARQAQLRTIVADVRAVLDQHRDGARIILGGVPMIAVDMLDFVRGDIRSFGIGVGLFIIVLLAISFRRLRWVIVPAATCALIALSMSGFLGLMQWPITVVSSNYISLILIISLSLGIHLIERHRELHRQHPGMAQAQLLEQTVRSKIMPSLYAVLTTMVSFASMAVSDIRPVIDFGLMMTCGMAIALVMTFLAVPAALAPLSPGPTPDQGRDLSARVNGLFARLVESRAALVGIGFAVLVLVSALGISRLTVENRFIDYFKPTTEIYRGMVVIDKELGGTTPLDVIVDAPQWFFDEQAEEEDDEFADLLEGDGGLSATSYWFNEYQLEEVHKIHDYLESLPETGKVLSLSSSMRMVQMLNDDEPMSNFVLAVMHKLLPPSIKESLFDPYMSEDGNQLRFAVRIIDSDPNLSRDALIKKIRSELVSEAGLEPEQVKLAGALVLYNNVLQSLFASQAQTLGVVFIVISFMILLLFRNIKMALIGAFPTLIAAGMVLGLIGIAGIPLDIMTITIASITIGIGVDNTIHYSYRFRDEVAERGYAGAVQRSHASVGRAMFYTTVVVTLGFSIMALSNFMPTIYFGLFTGVAMLFALLANLSLLPALLMWARPFAEGGASSSAASAGA